MYMRYLSLTCVIKYECCVFVRDPNTGGKNHPKMYKNAGYVVRINESYVVLVLAPSSGRSTTHTHLQ